MELFLGVIILIASAIIHEVMHGYVADKLGDPTARQMGRLTLNPIPHIDPLMSILVPLVLVVMGSPIIFGAAKPVPVNPRNFRDGKKDFALVALAGPLTNFFIAVLAALLARTFSSSHDVVFILSLVAFYNLILGFINLIPIPPLDGSRVFSYLLPSEISSFYNSIEPYGIFLVLILLSISIGGLNLGSILSNLVFTSMHFLGL
ncbi:MAG: site-2 protease family protein [Candidatus Levyibacteriota bacterium]